MFEKKIEKKEVNVEIKHTFTASNSLLRDVEWFELKLASNFSQDTFFTILVFTLMFNF